MALPGAQAERAVVSKEGSIIKEEGGGGRRSDDDGYRAMHLVQALERATNHACGPQVLHDNKKEMHVVMG